MENPYLCHHLGHEQNLLVPPAARGLRSSRELRSSLESCLTTGIHGRARTQGTWRYEYEGFLDEKDTDELVRAADNWRSYDADQRSAAQLRLNMVFNSVFKPLWGEDEWHEHELEIKDVFEPVATRVIGDFTAEAQSKWITADASSTVRAGAKDRVKFQFSKIPNSFHTPWLVRIQYIGPQRFEPRSERYNRMRETRVDGLLQRATAGLSSK
jgi:hypothetical protein